MSSSISARQVLKFEIIQIRMKKPIFDLKKLNFEKTPALNIENVTTADQEQEKTENSTSVVEINNDGESYRPVHPDSGKFGGQTIINFQPILSNSIGDVNAVVTHNPENETTGSVLSIILYIRYIKYCAHSK